MDPSRDDLDPQSWPAFRAECHQALDAALDFLECSRERAVWQPLPAGTRDALATPAPAEPAPVAAVREEIEQHILPFSTGNTHPRFFGWVHGAGTASSLLADIYASAMNANLGGREHAAVHVERQVIRWCCDLFSLPESAGGLLVTGTSAATLLALATARNQALGVRARRGGLQQAPTRLVGYTSREVHACATKAFEILGLGSDALRRVPVTAAHTIDLDALDAMIAEDRENGLTPFCVIGCAGTVNAGAMDPLDALAEVCAREKLWFHVDGAFGALAILAPSKRTLLNGLERADSIAFDFHKWMHVQYDAGALVVRDQRLLERSFGMRPDYLMRASRGLAAGEPWFSELGLDLSRGFRALKVWSTWKIHGSEAIGRSIERNCAQAQRLAALVEARNGLELLAPVALNIVCFRCNPGTLDERALNTLNANVVADLQESGIAAPSTTKVGDAVAIRVNLTNHRTRDEDIDLLVDAVYELAYPRIKARQ